MSISYNTGGGYLGIKQPWININGGWYPAKKVSYNLGGVWKEVWPMQRVYTWTGLGYSLNIQALFGYPTEPAQFIFINNGTIGGSGKDFALITGAFPAGSTLTIINNGYIQGMGGEGASYLGRNIYNNAGVGGNALYLQYPTDLQNNGYIWGGGGGGGAGSEVGGSNDNSAPGGGGAGVPGGVTNLSPWRPGYYYAATPGTQTAGGVNPSWGGNGVGGGPGLAGGNWFAAIGSSAIYKSAGAGPGKSIINTSYLTSITGNNGNQIRGPMT